MQIIRQQAKRLLFIHIEANILPVKATLSVATKDNITLNENVWAYKNIKYFSEKAIIHY